MTPATSAVTAAIWARSALSPGPVIQLPSTSVAAPRISGFSTTM